MATTSNSVVAFFSTEAQAANAIDALQSAGFQAHEIGAAANASYGEAGPSGFAVSDTTATPYGTSTATTVGHKTEGMWDKVKSFFEGDEGDAAKYKTETVREDRSYGSAYDYEPEDVSHSLEGMQIPQERSRYFESKFRTSSSGVLVTVAADGRQGEAERILTENGGDLGANTASSTYTEPNYSTAAAQTGEQTSGQQRIQLLGEVLRVHKDRVSRGEVRIRKEMITENQTVQVPVTREELVIERMPVNEGTKVQGQIGQNNEIRIPLSEEHASVDKQTVVREEVSVGKRAIEETEQVGDSVRHEELRVDDNTTAGTAAGTQGTRKS